MTRSAIDSMLLASTEPERLHAWYASALSPDDDTKEGPYRILRFGSFSLLIDQRDDVAPASAEPTRVIVNVEVDDARAAMRRIDEAGTRWVAPLEDREGSLFATATDPDGNDVQIIEMSAEHLAGMVGGQPGPLTRSRPFASFAVDDLDAARRFYAGTLGLLVRDEETILSVLEA